MKCSSPLTLLLASLVVLMPWLFMGYLAGDAVIHLIFAENALAGDWFAFNAGEASAGETSPGYMVVVMGLMTVFGQAYAPYAMVAVGYGAWLATVAVWAWVAGKVVPWRGAPWMMAALAGVMPGSVLNSSLGMENVLFALGVAGVFAWLLRHRAMERRLAFRQEFVLALMLGVLTLLRPEALLFAAMVLGVRFLYLGRWCGWGREFVHAAAAGIWVLGMYGAMIVVVWVVSGTLPFSGGASRLQVAIAEGMMLGPLPVHGKMLMRLAAYAPLTLMYLVGVGAVLTRCDMAHRGLVGLAAVVVAGFAVLFSTVLPAAHLARYTIFFWPMMVLVALVGVWCLKARLPSRGWVVFMLALVVGQGSVYGYEVYLRKQMAPGHPLESLTTVPASRVAATDALLAELGHVGPLPVSVGLVEVQMRYFYDPRIVVRSMDGIVDAEFRKHVQAGRFDYTGYLKARQVDYLLDYLDLNPRAGDWSPAMLQPLPEGTIMLRDGVKFERLGGRVTRMTYAD